VAYTDGGVGEASPLRRSARVRSRSTRPAARVHVGQTVIRFADDGYMRPSEARKLAEALVELADDLEGLR
jgi:hypothetical protein